MSEALWRAQVGTYIRTPRGLALIEEVDHQGMRFHCSLVTTGGVGMFTVDIETVLPEEFVGDLRDPEVAEKFLAGEQPIETPASETIEAVAMVCADSFTDCHCTWCYHVSSNGFHMTNQGQCECWRRGCPCVGKGALR